VDGGLVFWVWVGELEWGCGIEALMGALGGMGGKWIGVITFQGVSLIVVEYINIIPWVILLVI
jgi:hypothetical protein